MRFRAFRKAAHVIERVGLALAGAACGLRRRLCRIGNPALTTQGFLLLMMLLGFRRLLSRHRHAAAALRRGPQRHRRRGTLERRRHAVRHAPALASVAASC